MNEMNDIDVHSITYNACSMITVGHALALDQSKTSHTEFDHNI